MTPSHALPCPSCRRVLDSLSWQDDNGGVCQHCRGGFEFVGYPALDHTPARVIPREVLVAEHATCFFHAQNQAEAVCESCGRMLCAVCAVEFAGRRLCPSCIAVAQKAPAQAIGQRVLYDGIAMALAIIPMLLWPVTIISAPVALGLVIVGWRKPRSLVRQSRTKLIIAGTVALLQIIAWIVVIFVAFHRK